MTVQSPLPRVISRRLALAAGAAALAACAASSDSSERPSGARIEPLEIVTASGQVRHFTVEVVDDNASRERGLMFRRSMAPDAGMLFDFKAPQQVSFWMRNTYIPLDIIFIDAGGRILNIAERATPLSESPLPAAGATLGVLEINGGRAAQLGIGPGDLVRHRIFGG